MGLRPALRVCFAFFLLLAMAGRAFAGPLTLRWQHLSSPGNTLVRWFYGLTFEDVPLDLDGVPGPELISFEGSSNAAHLVIRSLKTGSIVAQTSETYSVAYSSVWIVDLNGDHLPDFVFQDDDGRLVAYAWNGSGLTLRWSLPLPSSLTCFSYIFRNVDADPSTELIREIGTDAASGGSRVEIYDGPTGSLRQTILPVQPSTGCPGLGVIDTDNTGTAELAVQFGDDIYLYGTDQSIAAVAPASSGAFTLIQSVAPNPSVDETTINFSTTRKERVALSVLDVSGRAIRTILDGEMEAGAHQVVWNGRMGRDLNASSGIYLIRLQTPDGVFVRKVTRLQ